MHPVKIEYSHSPRFQNVMLVPGNSPNQTTSQNAPRTPILRGDKPAADLLMWYDNKGLHFESRVFDPRFEQLYKYSDIWRGDCIQISIDPHFARTVGRLGSSDILLGFTQIDGQPFVQVWRWGAERASGSTSGPTSVPFEIAVNPDGQVYRVCIPWADMFPGSTGNLSDDHCGTLGFSLSVNGRNAEGACYDKWGSGLIGGTPDASKFGVLILDRAGRGIGAQIVHPELPEIMDESGTVRMSVLIPKVTGNTTSVELSLKIGNREAVYHIQVVQPGENRLAIQFPANLLADGSNDIAVRVVAQPSGVSLLSKSVRVIKEPSIVSVARVLCERIDWSRPELSNTEFASAYKAGRVLEAAIGFVNHLRKRSKPDLGYSKEYVAKLRASATPEYREKAKTEIATLMGTGFLGGSFADGRGTLLYVRPETLQVAGTKMDFDAFGKSIGDNYNNWNKSATHTSVHVIRFLQSAWVLEECSDETLVPILAFLIVTATKQWIGAKTWNDVSHGKAHNWWIFEFGGHWKCGLFFPEILGFAKFLAFGPENFERELRLLFQPDGFTREISAAYHIGTVDGFYDLARIGERNGVRFSPEYHKLLKASAEVEWKFFQPDGNFPAFGDCFYYGPHLLERAHSLAAIAGITETKYLAETLDPNWKSDFGAMHVESLNYPSIGEDLRAAYDRLPLQAPATLDTELPVSGYYFMRNNWSNTADFAGIEASARGLVDTSHGHSAVFDLKLCARGRAILISNGKGPDDHGTPARRWRVSTKAHSACMVDGQDPAPLKAIYRFSREVLPVTIDWISKPDFSYFHGVHEGFANLPNAVPGTHRKLFYLRNKYWILIDRFVAATVDAPHTYDQYFQVQGPSILGADGRCITQGKGGNLMFIPIRVADGTVESSKIPVALPLDDYPSPDTLCYTQKAAGHGQLITVLVPFSDAAVPTVSVKTLPVHCDDRILTSHEATGLEIQFGSERHVYVDLHTHWNLPWEVGGFKGDRMLGHSAVR